MTLYKIIHRRRIWIGVLCIFIIISLYFYLSPRRISSPEMSHHMLTKFRWLPLHNTSSLSYCRNSIQGPNYITDELGYICPLTWKQVTGCCDNEHSKRFDCSGCMDNSCCAVYEHCVSCCLHPDKKPVLQSILYQVTESFHPLYSLVKDQFELCLTKCRTSSQSVHHENSYRNPDSKYCYGFDISHLNPGSSESTTS